MRVLAFDTETFLITDRIQAPRPVCCTWSDGQNAFITNPEDPATYARWADPGNVFVGQTISYDLIVMMLWHPQFIPLILRALDEGRVFDTTIREQLQHLATNGGQGYRQFISLADLVLKYLGKDISATKEGDVWRLKYGTLHGVDFASWPKEALDYAMDDARLTWQVFQAQGGINATWPTEQAQVRGDMALRAIGVWGFAIDRKKNRELAARQQSKIDALQAAIGHHGWSGKGSQAKLAGDVSSLFNYKQKVILQEACGASFRWQDAPSTTDLREELEAAGKRGCPPAWLPVQNFGLFTKRVPGFPRTPKGKLQVSEDVIKHLFDIAPDLERFVKLHHEEKMLSSYIKPYDVEVSHGRYCSLVTTGRTSCSPGHQTIPRDDKKDPDNSGYRDQFVPRPGHQFGTVDYSMLELCTLAATIRKEFPHIQCALGDMIDRDVDVHSFTGALIAGKPYEEVRDNKKKEPYFTYRQGAKACYSADTELLTLEGWQRIDELYGREVMVAQYDSRQGIEFVIPTHWHHYFDCDFLHITSDFMDLCVTPEHRLVFITPNGVYFELLAKEYNPSDPRYAKWMSVNGGPNGLLFRPLGSAKVKPSTKADSFCVTVPSSWVLTRRNGKVTVSGNSNFGYPGGLGPNAFIAYAENNYGVKFTFDEAKQVREAWRQAVPEVDGYYLASHKRSIPRHGDVADSRLINGRVKAKCIFTEMSNFKFQGLAADGAKRAVYAIWREIMLGWFHHQFPQAGGYGSEHRDNPLRSSHIAAFVHDEVVAEHPEGQQGKDAFQRQQDLMVSEMQAECQNLITIRVEGKLQHNWGH
jgi:hypothetical protein